ncbi:MAG: 50S ribosomal protein L32e [Candidatus Methanomethylicota archaeon]|uniref:Large ribosomal subunit protein eL32 n=1 Tax=Thermoproteota archaeon TaxID=2056631 RepID=A0A497EZA5_9CREN|nr:MAG: 50S ribosomal protein L32e [Candidatus Verstraetearchaeota archaeon]RLE52526.1 MAG: 50S ribosomal protein L32e [Candidatus Verstraetearchaeota archaeon]
MVKKSVERLLKLREEINQKRPEFLRTDWWRFPRLGLKWRSPKGPRNKMRLKKSGRAAIVEVGYRGPAEVRGLHPSGYEEVLVRNIKDLYRIDPQRQVARIAHTVGEKKRAAIVEKAKALGIKIVNIAEAR